MKGDFTRDTFDAARHFSRVMMQQGRVQLDADWNEQAAIVTGYLRALARDMIGRHGMVFEGKAKGDDFLVRPADGSFTIDPGHYYVDGILCENDFMHNEKGQALALPYADQSDYPCAQPLEKGKAYLVYLDVWERHITCIEDPAIRETALGGPDTATRARVVWQAKVLTCDEPRKGWAAFWEGWPPPDHGKLSVWTRTAKADTADPCLVPPEGRYRGDENHLYRVEIHDPGIAGKATFKWSRDNGSVVFPVLKLEGDQATLERLGNDSQPGIKMDDWVELVDDTAELCDHRGTFCQVTKVNLAQRVVTLRRGDLASLPARYHTQNALQQHVLLRLWDGPSRNVVENSDLGLELGLHVKFANASESVAEYCSGDFWLIPARAISGDVEWLLDADGSPRPQAPHGVDHHYAELAWIFVPKKGDSRCTDLRRGVKRILS